MYIYVKLGIFYFTILFFDFPFVKRIMYATYRVNVLDTLMFLKDFVNYVQ